MPALGEYCFLNKDEKEMDEARESKKHKEEKKKRRVKVSLCY